MMAKRFVIKPVYPLGPAAARHIPSGRAALECSPLILAHPAPDTVILSALKRPFETSFPHVTTTTHLLCLFYLEAGRTGVTDREK